MVIRLRHILYFAAIAIASFGCRSEEKLEPADVEGFIKLIGESYDSPTIAIDMKHHPDGGFLLLASAETSDGGEIRFRPKLVKVDNNGTIEWSNTMAEGNWDYRSSSLTILGPDEFLIAGQDVRLSDGVQFANIAFASSNSFNFFKIQDNGVQVRGNMKGIIEKSDNNLVGIIQSVGSPSKSIIVEIPSTPPASGESINTINGIDEYEDQKNYITNSLLQDNGGRVYWAGPITDQGGIIKTQLSGIVPGEIIDFGPTFPGNSEEFEITDFSSPGESNPSLTNQFCLTGTITVGEEKDIRLHYTNKADQLFEMTYTFPGTDIPVSSAYASDGDLLILATTDADVFGEEEFMLLKINSTNGEITFPDGKPRYYGGEASETAAAVLPSDDGGIMMFGHTEFADVNTLLLIKVRNDGEFEKK